MIILDVIQGSPEWLAARGKCRCASEAPVMMGASKQTKRSELLRLKATGDEKEFSDWAQKHLLDRGHEVEAGARLILEEQIGEELYPTTATDDSGRYLASYDGVTMGGDTGMEHKLWNKELAAQVIANDLPASHFWQLEHQILVGGLKRVLFVCSDGTPEHFVVTEYKPVPGRAEQLIAGWKQFDEDLKNYQHVEVIPAAVATPTMSLPAVSIQVNGQMALVSNLDLFGEKLKSFIANINKAPDDDQGFADAESAIKTLEKAQTALEAAEAGALAQTSSIDDMRRTVALYVDQARSTRLMLEKMVKGRKETLRQEIVQGATVKFSQHVASLNARLGKNYMPTVPTNFTVVIKGLKTIASLRDAVDTELARAKIAANEVADRIAMNLAWFAEYAKDYEFLFPDIVLLVLKAQDDFMSAVKLAIAGYKEKEQKRLDAEREKIRAEEVRKMVAAAPAPAPAVNLVKMPAATAPAKLMAEDPALGADALLLNFVERFGKLERYAGVVAAIRECLQPQQLPEPYHALYRS